MAEKKSAGKATRKPAKRSAATSEASGGFSKEERAAMRDRAKELKAASSGATSGASVVLEKLAEMSAQDRAMGERVHALIMAAAPDLTSRLWYGMPAYAREGKVVCFFQGAQKFKTRYATLGFSADAALDEGNMWPTSFALMKLTATDEARITALVKQAVG